MQKNAIAIVALVLTVCVPLLVSAYNDSRSFKHKAAVKECNRKGAIYSDGMCQHVFAPICRRL